MRNLTDNVNDLIDKNYHRFISLSRSSNLFSLYLRIFVDRQLKRSQLPHVSNTTNGYNNTLSTPNG
jgi:hypothetical protein